MVDTTSTAISALLGVAAHAGYFSRYEVHNHVYRILTTWILTTLSLAVMLITQAHMGILAAIGTSLWLAISFVAGLFTSIAIYRLFLNPLNRFPGPLAARLTDFYMASITGKKLNQHQVLHDLHQRHGKIVRRGATELSIADSNFFEPTYSARTTVHQAVWYDLDDPPSILADRDKARHALRRREWAPAFSDKALRAYEPRVQTFADKLLVKIREQEGRPMNMSLWIKLYAFDVMGSLAFGKDYAMLDSGKTHHALRLLTEGGKIRGISLPMWFMKLLLGLPFDSVGRGNFLKFCQDELADAVQHHFFDENFEKGTKPTPGSTIASWLYHIYENSPNPGRDPIYQTDARVLIAAGSDTTATSTTWMFYELAKHPENQTKIREEVRTCATGDWSDKDLRNCKHLDATIQESLRLHHPAPAGMFRTTPPEGLRVGDTFIPGGTTYTMPPYTVGRDEDLYERAEEFIPERWYSKPGMIKGKVGFPPFLMGPGNCIGKNVAMMEMRTLTATLLQEYEVSFAPGEDGSRLLNESLDHFTMTLAPLELVFRKVE